MFKRGFPPIAINFGNLLQGRQSWNKLCENPPLDVALVVREFRTNLLHKVGSTIFERWKWVPFDANPINTLFGLKEVENDELRA